MVGPTAAGKSEVALRLAEELDGAIVSVDSMQVYRGMDIGTAKASAEDRARVPHHMLDLAEPEDEYAVAEFQRAGRRVLEDLAAAGRRAVVAGGSGLHFRALVDPLDFPPTDPVLRAELEDLDAQDARARLLAADPAAGEHVDLANPRRVVRALEIARLTGQTPSWRAALPRAAAVREYRADVPLVVIGNDPGPGLRTRVERRVAAMHAAGLLGEVEALADRLGRTARQAVNYKELLPVVRGESNLEDAVSEQVRATMGLSKRQRTFFGRDPRVRWLPWHEDLRARAAAAREALEEVGAWNS